MCSVIEVNFLGDNTCELEEQLITKGQFASYIKLSDFDLIFGFIYKLYIFALSCKGTDRGKRH